jgi:hypothetical protein
MESKSPADPSKMTWGERVIVAALIAVVIVAALTLLGTSLHSYAQEKPSVRTPTVEQAGS